MIQLTFEFYVGPQPTYTDRHKFALEIQAGFLSALLTSDHGIASIDDGYRDLSVCHCDGGKWVGGLLQGLKSDGIIVYVNSTVSKRKCRHGGTVGVWRLVNEEKARRRVESLERQLTALEQLEHEEEF